MSVSQEVSESPPNLLDKDQDLSKKNLGDNAPKVTRKGKLFVKPETMRSM